MLSLQSVPLTRSYLEGVDVIFTECPFNKFLSRGGYVLSLQSVPLTCSYLEGAMCYLYRVSVPLTSSYLEGAMCYLYRVSL